MEDLLLSTTLILLTLNEGNNKEDGVSLRSIHKKNGLTKSTAGSSLNPNEPIELRYMKIL